MTTVKQVIPDPSGTKTTDKHVIEDSTTMNMLKYDKCMNVISGACHPIKPTQPTYGQIGPHGVAKEDKEAIAFIRSPQAMVFYRGELIDSQIGSRGTFKPEIRQRRIDPKSGKPPWEEVSLFRVRTGGSGGAAAVSVPHEGETYYIPRDGDERGRSMHVLSLVSLVFGLHQSSKELPGTGSFRVIGD